MAHRLHQLAHHADGLRARVAMGVVFTSLCLRLPSSNIVAGITGCPGPEYTSRICSSVRFQLPFRFLLSLVELPSTFRTWADEDPTSCPETSCAVTDGRGVSEDGFVGSIRHVNLVREEITAFPALHIRLVHLLAWRPPQGTRSTCEERSFPDLESVMHETLLATRIRRVVPGLQFAQRHQP